MEDSMKPKLLKTFIISLILTLIVFISPSSSSSSSPQKKQTNLNTIQEPSHHTLIYIKKTTPFILNRRLRDYHRLRRYNNHYYYYYHHSVNNPRRNLHEHRAEYFKMMTKNKKSLNRRPVRPDTTFSVMLPKGFVPPSGSSPCHNQNPNSASTLFCDFSTNP